jgi:hypothetical protein
VGPQPAPRLSKGSRRVLALKRSEIRNCQFVTYIFNKSSKSLTFKYFNPVLHVTPYSSKTWQKLPAKSLILKDRCEGVFDTNW